VTRPRIAITLGDPRGIGPEIVAAVLGDVARAIDAEVVIIGPEGTAMAPDLPIGTWRAGDTEAHAGALAGAAIERAVALIQAGGADALVTAPIDKHALALGGYADPGHTEMLSRLTGRPTAMMLASDRLRVVLATTHRPLREVPDALTHACIVESAALTRAGLQQWFGIAEPRVALCALNPHAGDGGRFGDEDDRVLAPAARAAGLRGPFPADTVFVRALRGEFDAVIAPYHDVGMTAIKVASFGEAVNVTLGLPFPRTSPDHGTALDIAGIGVADPSSMRHALTLAVRLAARPPAAH
jgi:4-hydroxythreonine-4-phosphate dehydrogenase